MVLELGLQVNPSSDTFVKFVSPRCCKATGHAILPSEFPQLVIEFVAVVTLRQELDLLVP